jgi:DNA polymerase-4
VTLDSLRDRYGPDIVKRAVLLDRPAGLEVPLLPD